MNKQEQARATRAANKAKREARKAAQAAERERDKALILDALRAVLQDPEATTEQRLFAVAVLDRMQYYNFVPRDMRHSDALILDFAKRLEAFQDAE